MSQAQKQPDQLECPRRNPRHAYRSVGEDGGLVVDSSGAKIQVLNPVGSRIYSLLDGAHTRDEIVRAVMEEFEVPEDEARRDLDRFLAELRANAMLVSEEA